jgi:hypothetical protein
LFGDDLDNLFQNRHRPNLLYLSAGNRLAKAVTAKFSIPTSPLTASLNILKSYQLLFIQPKGGKQRPTFS